MKENGFNEGGVAGCKGVPPPLVSPQEKNESYFHVGIIPSTLLLGYSVPQPVPTVITLWDEMFKSALEACLH